MTIDEHRIRAAAVAEADPREVWLSRLAGPLRLVIHEHADDAVFIASREAVDPPEGLVPTVSESEYIGRLRSRDVYFQVGRTRQFGALLREYERLLGRPALRLFGNLFVVEAAHD